MGHRVFGPALLSRALAPRGRRWGALAGAAGLAILLVAGCTNSASETSAVSMSSASAAKETSAAAAGAAAPAAAAGTSASAPASSGAASASAGDGSSTGSGKSDVNVSAGVQAQNRQVIRTASVTLEIPYKSTGNSAAQVAHDNEAVDRAVSDAAIEVRGLAVGAGFVSASSGGGTTISITLRVPVDGYESVMDRFTGIGTVTGVTENTQDVTAQMIDINSRVKSATDVIASLRTLLSKATKIGDILTIEDQLNSREADLESMKSQLAGLSDQTSLSTITVVVKGVITDIKPVVAPQKPAPPVARSGFLGGLANGWDAARTFGHGVLTVVGTLIPFLPVVLVVVIALLIWRRRIRRAHPMPTLATSAGDPHPVD